MKPAIESERVQVIGRVQGVGYRDACVHAARALGVTGWVRNRLDGTVEALIQGSAPQLAEMRAWMRRGPPLAHVDAIIAGPPQEPVAACRHFERHPTA